MIWNMGPYVRGRLIGTVYTYRAKDLQEDMQKVFDQHFEPDKAGMFKGGYGKLSCLRDCYTRYSDYRRPGANTLLRNHRRNAVALPRPIH